MKIGDKTASVTVIGNEKNGFTGTLTENFSIVANAGILEVSGCREQLPVPRNTDPPAGYR